MTPLLWLPLIHVQVLSHFLILFSLNLIRRMEATSWSYRQWTTLATCFRVLLQLKIVISIESTLITLIGQLDHLPFLWLLSSLSDARLTCGWVCSLLWDDILNFFRFQTHFTSDGMDIVSKPFCQLSALVDGLINHPFFPTYVHFTLVRGMACQGSWSLKQGIAYVVLSMTNGGLWQSAKNHHTYIYIWRIALRLMAERINMYIYI